MATKSESDRRELTREDIDAVLAFLPLLEQPGLQIAEWHPYRDELTGKALPMAYCSAAAELDDFIQALYKHHWVYSFDWTDQAWQKRMFALRDDPARMGRARLNTLRKMLVTYARADRFCEGALVEACEQGYVVAILRRAKEIIERRPSAFGA